MNQGGDGVSTQGSSHPSPSGTAERSPQCFRPETWSDLGAACLLGKQAGSYRIVEAIGQGAIGAVYLAEHPRIGARVAIKVLHPFLACIPEMGERFLREARATNVVDNPHVLKIQDFGKLDDGRDYAVMDFLHGSPLDSLVEREGKLQPGRALRLLAQAADGIAAAHGADVTHRDVKPGNLFVTTRGGKEHLYVLDFGIAKLGETHPSSTKTTAGMLIGTPAYCAPEQATRSAVGPAADVYALGTVAYELLTGGALFTAPTPFELLALKLQTKDVKLDGLGSDTPAALRCLLESMLAFDAERRPAMSDVRDGFTRCLEELGCRESESPTESDPAFEAAVRSTPIEERANGDGRMPVRISEMGATGASARDLGGTATTDAALQADAAPAPSALPSTPPEACQQGGMAEQHGRSMGAAPSETATRYGFPTPPHAALVETRAPVAYTPLAPAQQALPRAPRRMSNVAIGVAIGGGLAVLGLVAMVVPWLGAAQPQPETMGMVTSGMSVSANAHAVEAPPDSAPPPVVDVAALPVASESGSASRKSEPAVAISQPKPAAGASMATTAETATAATGQQGRSPPSTTGKRAPDGAKRDEWGF